jgi:alpha-glucosidase (family GH31 glycosyl hydrolase)
MNNILYSAWNNYTNFGSDIGGYRSGPGPFGRTQQLFMRWYQLSAFMPLMENGGNGEHRPWAYDPPGTTVTVDNYRMFTDAHYELVPYLLTTGTQAFEAGVSAITPRVRSPLSELVRALD